VADKSLPNGDICLEAKVALKARRDEPVGAKPSSEPVLIVERDQAALSAMVRTLRGAGYQTTGVATFEEARHQIEVDPPRLLVTDARLERHHGLHLAFIARAQMRRFHAVIVGERGDPILEAEAIRAGASFVIKPLSLDALVALVGVLTGELPVLPDEPLYPYPASRRHGDRRQLITPRYALDRRMLERRDSLSH
jgi:DNA-binding response OmpR family regulator